MQKSISLIIFIRDIFQILFILK